MAFLLHIFMIFLQHVFQPYILNACRVVLGRVIKEMIDAHSSLDWSGDRKVCKNLSVEEEEDQEL